MSRSFFITMTYMILSLTLVLTPKTIYGNDLFDTIDRKWSNIKKYEINAKHINIIDELIQIENLLYNAEIKGTVRSQGLWKIFGYPLNMQALEQRLDTSDIRLAKAFEFDGIRNIMMNDLSKSKKQLLKALIISGDQPRSFRLYRWLGFVSSLQENIRESISFYNRSIDATLAHLNPNSKAQNRLLCSIHASVVPVHVNRGDHVSAKRHANLALKHARLTDEDYYISTALTAKIIALSNTGSSTLTLKLLEEQKEFLDNMDDNGKTTYYNTLGRALTEVDEFEKAIIAQEKAIALGSANKVNVLLCKQVIGQCYFELGEYDKAVSVFDKIIIAFSFLGGNESSLAEAYFSRSRTLKEIGNLNDAKIDLKEALTLKGEFSDWQINYYPLMASIYMDYYDKSENNIYLDSVKMMLDVTDSLFNQIRIDRRYFDDQSNLGQRFYASFASNISLMYRIYENDPKLIDPNRLFKYFEILKAHSLKETLKTDDAVIIGNIPDTILVKEREFKLHLAELNQRIYRSEISFPDSSIIQELNIQFDQEKERYFSFLKLLEIDFPGYFRHQYTTEVSDVYELQKKLSNTEVLIEYFITNEDIFILQISNASFSFSRKTIPENWNLEVNRFKKLIANPQSDIHQFVSSAHYFYSLLLKEIIDDLPPSILKLRIVPDDLINFIPLEVLIKDAQSGINTFKDLDYLMKHYTISYLQSASQLIHENKKENYKNNYVGFAPLYQNEVSDSLRVLINERTRGQYLDLPFARKSVEQVSVLFNGDTFINEQATIESFMKNGLNTQILHLAMHGIIDLEEPSFSHLKFYSESNDDSNLYTSQVYALDLNCDLVVLSACNTGVGKLINGDGIQNMSRAFNFAGVKNTIMSLWSVPDVQTAQLNYHFFKLIKEGVTIDKALQNAKINFLDETSELRAHPYYWAGLVANGSMGSIQFPSAFHSSFIIGGILIVTLLLIFVMNYWKRKF